MPDASAGIASGLYWVFRGKLPTEDLEEDDDQDPDQYDEQPPEQSQSPQPQSAWGRPRGFGR